MASFCSSESLKARGAEALTAERMADDIYPSLVYFQDNYGVSVEQLLVSGVRDWMSLHRRWSSRPASRSES